ncbi:MAG: methylated-DNA--[Bacteroidales bacterium]|nr:methylated-DNA--[protein]-cysteine S-methyltransferase [Bacteroidales bacterium]
MVYSAHYHSPLGDITLASDGSAIVGLWFDGQKHFGSTLGTKSEEQRIENRATQPEVTQPLLSACRWLDEYFSGREPGFTPPMSFRGTVFQQRVCEALLAIPYGQTVTYGELARRLGCRSAQAVGGAVGRNPISIIVPCHRVVGADGSLTGYAGGLDRKRALLQLERKNYFAI